MKIARRRMYTKNNPSPKLTEEQRELAESHIPWARKATKTMRAMFPQFREEFESASMMALTEAARDFDPGRGSRFATFSIRRIRGAVFDVLDSMKLLSGDSEDNRSWFSSQGLQPSGNNSLDYIEKHGNVLVSSEPPPVGTEADDIDSFEGRIRPLPAQNRHVCRRMYLYGKTMTEVGEELGCSPSEVNRIHRQSLKLLAPAYDEDGRPFVVAGPRRRNRKVKSCSESDSATTPA